MYLHYNWDGTTERVIKLFISKLRLFIYWTDIYNLTNQIIFLLWNFCKQIERFISLVMITIFCIIVSIDSKTTTVE